MQIKKQFSVSAPPARVWEVLAHEFDQVDRWASAVSRSVLRTDGAVPEGAPASGRVCESQIGPIQESILTFDEGRRVLAYEAHAPKMPFFVRGLRNRWEVLESGDNTSTVHMNATIRLMVPFNLLMGPLIRFQMGRLLSLAVEELAHYVETGTPHPRKVAATRKAHAQKSKSGASMV